MNFSSMEYFDVLAQERSFTKAAERLHMTQQSLSSHIAGMEKELGCQLIVRHIPLELTYAGKVLLSHARKFQKAHEDMLREFCDISQNQKGVLRIGTAATRGQLLLPETVSLYHRIYPHIRIDLTEAANDALYQGLLKGTLDLAIGKFSKSLPEIAIKEFYCEELVLCIDAGLFSRTYGTKSSDYKARFLVGDFAGLKDLPFVLGGMDDVDGRLGLEFLKESGIDSPVIMARSHNVGTLLKLSVAGDGACFCPKNIVRATLSKKPKDTVLVFPLGNKAVYPIHFGYKKRSYQWKAIETFIKCAQKTQHRLEKK